MQTVNFRDFWPVGHYANEAYVGWNYSVDDWTTLTGNVLNMIDQNIGDIICLELGDEIKNGTKGRNNLV